MTIVDKVKQNLTNLVPAVQEKMARLYGAETAKPKEYNPFLDKDGNVFNKYVNYQALLDNPNVASKVKGFISDATGLSPTPAAATAPKTTPAVAPTTTPTITPTVTPTATPTEPTTDVPSTGNSIADAAKNYMGTPYVWGGESMDEGGMDCSGFVYNALKDAGYNVGRTTAQGYRQYGTAVSKEEMQPGDLIFYGKNKNDAGHIGIYIGNGQMIHSSGGSKNTKDNPGKGVSIANVDYRSDFIEARRY